MPELPASVRLSLWVTRAWRDGSEVPAAVAHALPDVDHLDDGWQVLTTWGELGEQALLVALPGPGRTAGMPRTSPEGLGAAVEAGECLVVPGIGGVLVPRLAAYGSPGDEGWRVGWQRFDAEPMPRHVVEALEVSPLERTLRSALMDATDSLEAAGGQPFLGSAAAELAEARLETRWGLPDGIPARHARVISLAGTVSRLAETGLTASDGALDAGTSARRGALLTSLLATSEQVLADATNAACAVIAGWRPA
ncbi:MAG: hypothetical protein LWW86_06595 [Micrococcales bacterium]|nr:hypothetical protein [Micrococcales bacterium]